MPLGFADRWKSECEKPDAYETVLGFDSGLDKYVLCYWSGSTWYDQDLQHPITLTHWMRLDGPLAPPSELAA